MEVPTSKAGLNATQKFPFNRPPYCVTFRFLFCCSSNTLLIRGNSLGSTNSTQLQARLNNAFGRQLNEEYIGYKHIIIFIWKGFLSWLIWRYLQVRWTWTLPLKFPFNRHPYYLTFDFLFCCSSNTLLIRRNSLGSTKSTQLQARLNNAFGRQLTEEYIGYKHNIIFIWKGFLSWLIWRYLQVRRT